LKVVVASADVKIPKTIVLPTTEVHIALHEIWKIVSNEVVDYPFIDVPRGLFEERKGNHITFWGLTLQGKGRAIVGNDLLDIHVVCIFESAEIGIGTGQGIEPHLQPFSSGGTNL
jgi:hypothetical protein